MNSRGLPIGACVRGGRNAAIHRAALVDLPDEVFGRGDGFVVLDLRRIDVRTNRSDCLWIAQHSLGILTYLWVVAEADEPQRLLKE